MTGFADKTVQAALSEAIGCLQAAGVDDARWDAEELLSWAGGPDRTHLPLLREAALSEKAAARFEAAVARRAQRIPLQQIIGTAWFMGLPFSVNEAVLCPRQDTELLAERALEILRESRKPAPRVLDLCCGSGCIGISLARLHPGTQVVLSDLSEEALAVAKKNAERNNVSEQLRFAQGDLFNARLEDGSPLSGPFDLICCNPPYVPSGEIGRLMPEVKDHEPAMALDGGADGLDFYRRLARELNPLASPRTRGEAARSAGRGRPATILLEIGCEQGEAVRNIFETALPCTVTILKDLAGLDRVAEARMRN